MAILNLKSAVFASAAASLLFSASDAFSPVLSPVSRTRRSCVNVMKMANDENLDGVQVTSARKELKFDDKSGRFFETNLGTEECIPDEEFCTIDEDTGKKVRLTIAEKERIFLDALQVRQVLTCLFLVTLDSFSYLTRRPLHCHLHHGHISRTTPLEDNCYPMRISIF